MIRPYVEICRVSNLPTVWTNVLAAILITTHELSIQNFFILAFSMSLFYSGGMSLNDICDVDIDRVKKPFRPIPSGRISVKQAYSLTIMLFLFAIFLLLLVPYKKAIWGGVFLLIAISAYNTFHKKHGWSVFLMASCRLMIFITSSLAVLGKVAFPVLIAGLLQFIYIIGVSVVARYEIKIKGGYSYPVIPGMIACISLLDGIVMAVMVSPEWLAAGIVGVILTLLGQKYVRGD